MSYLKLESIEKKYGDRAVVSQLSLQVGRGKFLVLLGPSGCGKTTCLRMIAGLEKNTAGLIHVDGKTVSDPSRGLFVPPERRHMGMVFQSYAVWPHMNVFDNVAYPLRQRRPRVPKHEISARVGRVLSLVELVGLERRKPDTLSGGQQQRVALARALVAEPSVLLLDEPFCNLDAKLRRKMQVDVRRLQQELGLTVVHVTHDQEEAKVMSDSVAIMFDGKLEQFGTYQDICQKPASAFVADFMR